MTFLSIGAVSFYWSRARTEAARLQAIVELSAQGRSADEIEQLLGSSGDAADGETSEVPE